MSFTVPGHKIVLITLSTNLKSLSNGVTFPADDLHGSLIVCLFEHPEPWPLQPAVSKAGTTRLVLQRVRHNLIDSNFYLKFD
jgi:hypothetical protein